MSEFRVPALRIRQGEKRQLLVWLLKANKLIKLPPFHVFDVEMRTWLGISVRKYVAILRKSSATLKAPIQ